MTDNSYLTNQNDDLEQLEMLYLPPGEVQKHLAFDKHKNNLKFKDRYLKARFFDHRPQGCYLHMITFDELIGKIPDLKKTCTNVDDFNQSKINELLSIDINVTYKDKYFGDSDFPVDDFYQEVLSIYLETHIFKTDIKKADVLYCNIYNDVGHLDKGFYYRFFDFSGDSIKLCNGFTKGLGRMNILKYEDYSCDYFLRLKLILTFNFIINIADIRPEMVKNFSDRYRGLYNIKHKDCEIMFNFIDGDIMKYDRWLVSANLLTSQGPTNIILNCTPHIFS